MVMPLSAPQLHDGVVNSATLSAFWEGGGVNRKSSIPQFSSPKVEEYKINQRPFVLEKF